MNPQARGVDAETAWQHSLGNAFSTWADARIRTSVRERLAQGLLAPHDIPKFQIAADDVFFCIGSCFARVIEDGLISRGLDVASGGLQLEPVRARKRRTAIVNKFTTPSMRNELEWAFGERPFPDEALIVTPEGTFDLQLKPNIAPGEHAAVQARRAIITDYFARLRRASVVIMTLGLSEVWFDNLAGIYLNGVPSRELAVRYPGRFTVHAQTHRENVRRS